MRPTICVLRAFTAHLQLQVGLLTKVDHEGVRNLGEWTAADLAGRVLDDEVNLMQRTPDAKYLVDGLLDHQRDKPAEPARHRVLAVRANRHQLDPPQGTEMIEQLADHLEDVDGRVPLEERNAYEMDVEQDTSDAGADANVEERRVEEVSGVITGERERPDLVVVQNIRQDLQVCANVHADHLANLMIVEAGKSRVTERILVVGDHDRRLHEG